MRKYLLISFLLVQSSLFGQSASNYPEISFLYSVTDFFIRPAYNLNKNKLEHKLFAGIGVNRTFFQGRFFPEVGYRMSYKQNIFSTLSLLPYAEFGVNRLKVSTAGAHYWFNPEMGVCAEMGVGHQLGIGAGFRSLLEFWEDQSKMNRSVDFGLTVSIYYKL